MRASLLISIVVTAACGGGVPMRAGPLDPGDSDNDPSMECLPDPDVTEEAFTRRMRFGWTLAEESFLVPPPEAPHDQTAQNLELWSDEVLAPWLERKTHTVEAARRELDHAAEENHRQRIIGGAIVGLMYEDVARALRAIPAPEELESEPEIRDIFHQILRGQARPFLEHSRRAYNACAQNAIQPESMRHWSRFCAARQDRLPPSETEPRAPSGETTVEVIAD
jgi:hypothetical protein